MLFNLSRALLASLSFLAVGSELVAAAPSSQTCANPVVRKEWGNLSKAERRNYIDAVLCLQKKPSKFPKGQIPGSKSLYDDFATLHINQTRIIHSDGVFLAWHRNFVWIWEQTLRSECGYKGYQPYWDWPKWVANGKLSESPLFDGSDTSIGGDGYPNPNYNGSYAGFNHTNLIPKANGGGCMMSGPFVGLNSTMGPFAFDDALNGLPSNWTSYTPHCVRRDLNDKETHYLNYTYYNQTLAKKTIDDFQGNLTLNMKRNLGLHGNGHLSVGPDMFDFFASPFDPAFMLHHGGIDRIWYQWQLIDPKRRTYGDNALNGTYSFLNIPPTPLVNFDTHIYYQPLGKDIPLRDAMSTKAGRYCYVYD